uniref:Aminotransferase-like plant mobile domain-containing protein n=1 Tax=Fagus sylvatica TaxID=28930 RepID=A0A2N9IXC6_FAGSY
MASSSTAPVGPPLQPGSGKELEVPPSAPAASTEAMVDVPVAPSPVPGEPVPAPPSPVSGEAEELQGGIGTGRSSGLEPSVDQAWVPNLDEISELLIQKGDLQAVPINFDFLCACSKDWSHWVDREILDPDFWDRLVDAGVHWSILISRSCNMFRDTEALRKLLRSCLRKKRKLQQLLRKRASTRLSGWPAHFSQVDEAAVRRAAFDIVFPLHHYSWATFTRNWTCSMIARFKATLATSLSAVFNTSVLQTFFWEHSVSYTPIARDKSAAWGRFSDLPREFLEQFPDFRANLPLDHMGMDYPGFTCASILRKFYEPFPLIRDLKADDYPEFVLLIHREPGLPSRSCLPRVFISSPTVHSEVQRQFGLDQGVPVGPQGDRLGFNTPSMGAYWQRFTQSMVDLVIAGRSATTPMSVHRKASVSNPYLAPPSQSAISYANSQKLGFAEWDASRGGWIAYTIHLPEGWRNSVTIVEDRLIMVSKRGQVNKRDAPVDPGVYGSPCAKNQLSLPLPLLKERQGQGKRASLSPWCPSAAEGSTAVPLEEPSESTESPPEKARVGKKSKSTVPETSAVKESATASVKGPTESTAAPSKPKSASAGSSQQSSKRIAASRPPKSQKKVDVSSSSPDEEEPSAVPGPSPPQKKKFTAPLFPLGAAGRTRSKSGPKVTHESGRSSGGVVDIEDSDVADDDVIASPVRKDAPQAAAVDQDEDLGKSTAGSSEAGDESMGEEHSSSSASFFDSTPVWGVLAPMEEELAIVPHGDHDDDSAVDTDADPISFSLPQTVLTRAGFDISMAHVMEGVSLFGVTPSLRAIPAGGFVIPASRLSSEDSPVAGGALVPERTPAQKPYRKWVRGGPRELILLFHGLGCRPMENFVPWTWLSSYGKVFPFGYHRLGCRLMDACVDDTVHVLEDVGEIGTAGEVTAVSPPPRPTNEAGPSVDVGSLSSEVAAFFREFDARAPNPHPEQFFWSFNGPLVPFGDFWVPNDCSPYLSRLSAGHSDFTKGFKLSIGLGGPMMSLLGSVLAAMDESSLEDVTKTQILAWRSVIQDLMDVGFDLGFMMKRLRQMAQHLFGKRLADEIKALQHQIALLQDSLAELTAYQAVMTSTEGVVPRPERGGSFLDSLLD